MNKDFEQNLNTFRMITANKNRELFSSFLWETVEEEGEGEGKGEGEVKGEGNSEGMLLSEDNLPKPGPSPTHSPGSHRGTTDR